MELRVRVWVCAYREFGAKQFAEWEMSGYGRNQVVPVDVVQGIVSQLSEVSQHTTSATTAMRHLVAEIANLRELRTRDATSVVEALAAASTRSGSPGAVDNGVPLSTFYHGWWQWRRGKS